MSTSTSNERPHWQPRVAVIGAGAVGGYFGGRLARAGASVVMIGRKPFANAVNTRGLRLETLHFDERVRIEAATEMSAARGSELVLFCVKTTDNVATASALAPFLSSDAIVLCLQNGVDNAEQIRTAGINALPAVVYVAASMPDPGHIRHVGRGDLVLGPTNPIAQKIAGLFAYAGVPCRLTENLEGELWAKFICNCALNAVSALGRATYGELSADANARRLVDGVIAELLAVACAGKITIPGMPDFASAQAAVLKLTTQIADALSSTAQDLNRGKPTEIDSLNGYVARRGRELGVPTPLNQALFALVKLAERKAIGRKL